MISRYLPLAGILFGLSCCLAHTAEHQITLSTSEQIRQASRGEGAFASLPPDTTFLIKNGIYQTPPSVRALFYVKTGGTARHRRHFKGESREGVVISGRATVCADHVEFSNMTFDLTDFTPEEGRSFDTLAIAGAKDIRVHDITFTGDGTKGKKGGHIGIAYSSEKVMPSKIIIENCLIERFGRRDLPVGRLDHGIYFSEVRGAIVRYCEIRYNAGRGIQFYGHTDQPGLITGVIIDHNVIHHNGTGPYTDGVVVGAVSSKRPDIIGTVVIQHNKIYQNAFSGIRLNTSACTGLVIRDNDFWYNAGQDDKGAAIFIDSGSEEVPITIRDNAFACRRQALRTFRCLKHLRQTNNRVEGHRGQLSHAVQVEKMFRAPENGDFYRLNPPETH